MRATILMHAALGSGILVAFLVVTISPMVAASSTNERESPAGESVVAGDVDAEEQLAEARLHFENGVALLEASPPNYQDAYRQFVLAYEKSGHSWKVLGNLGFTALNLERDGEALRYYQDYLDHGEDEVSREERKSIERELLLIEGNMARLTVQSPVEGARISVLRKGSSVPAQLYPLEEGRAELGVRAGQLIIIAQAGDREQKWEVVLSPGESKSHTFDFDDDEAAMTVDSAPGTSASVTDRGDAPGQSTNAMRSVGYATGGLGIAAIVGAVITGVLSQEQAASAREQCINDVCPEFVENDFGAASDLALLTNVLFVGGGLLTAAGVTFVIVGAPSQESTAPTASLELAPMVAPSFSGVTAVGRF